MSVCFYLFFNYGYSGLVNEKEKEEEYARCRTSSRKTEFCNKSLNLVIIILPYVFNLDFPVMGTVLRIIFDQCDTREKEVGRETVCVLCFQPGEAVLLFVTSQ